MIEPFKHGVDDLESFYNTQILTSESCTVGFEWREIAVCGYTVGINYCLILIHDPALNGHY
jgi:hypothetical protein